LGATLSTLSVTLPIMIGYATFVLNLNIPMALSQTEILLCFTTIITAMNVFASKKTSAFYGILLLTIFCLFLAISITT
jgi:Ca2+/H+ antiporter